MLSRRAWPSFLLAGLSYLAITLALAWPTVRDIRRVVTSDLGDPLLNVWILWWNTTGLPFTERWWSPPVFHPAQGVFTYSEHLLGVSVISSPVYWLTGEPILAYNVAFLATFPLSGLAVYLLVMELTGRRDAAWLAGLAFAFAPYRMDHLSHLQVLSSYWMPVGLFALHRYHRDPRTRWLVLFGGATVMTGLCNGYYLLFYPVLVGMWVLWFTRNEAWWRRAGAVTLAGLVAVALLAPTLLTYQRVHDEMGFVRGVGEIRGFSADVSGLLSGPPTSVFWSFPDGVYRAEGQLFPGLVAGLLVLAGLLHARWRSSGPEPRPLRVLRYVVGVVSVAFALAVFVRVLFGPWELALGGISVSVERSANVVAQGMLFWFFTVVLSPVGVWAYRRHSAFGFYALAAFFLFVLALGPEPKAFGHDFMAHSAYKALMYLPGYDGLRVPARFWMLATICVSTLVGLSFTRIAPVSWGAPRRWGLVLLVAGGVLADGWVVWPTATAPSAASLLDRVQGPVAELPFGRGFQDIAAMFRTTSHRQPLVNGFSGYSPPYYPALRYGLRQRNPEVLDALADLGARFVRIDRERDGNARSERFVSGYEGTQLVAETEAEAVYALPLWRRHRPKPDYGAPLEVAELRASVRPERIGDAVDGALDTRWDGGAQTAGQTVVVRLAETAPVGAVVLNLGPYRADFPRGLVIESSRDGERWDEVWAGSTEVTAIRGAMTHPRSLPLTFSLGGRVARYLRLRLTEDDPVYYWSIAELSVFGA